MTAYLLELYLKFNLLLQVSLLLWMACKVSARWLRFEVRPTLQLHIARFLFSGVLLAVPLMLALQALLPGPLPAYAVAGEMTISAGLEQGLDRRVALIGGSFSLTTVLVAVFAVGLSGKAWSLYRQWRHLKLLVGRATSLRVLHGVELLVSQDVAAPFSTRALGKPCVVLPWQLLESPGNLRLAVKHELQHLRNGDLGWVLLGEAIKTLCFWNPASYVWHNEFHCLQEFACDEVLVDQRRVDANAYGHCLLEVASGAAGTIPVASSNMVPRLSLLRRRIMMLQARKNRKLAGLRAVIYGGLFGSGLAAASLAVFAQHEETNSLRKEYLPIQTSQPRYPEEAVQEGLVGWVQVEFTVDEEGRVADPEVVDSCVDGRGFQQTDARGCLVEYADIFHDGSLEAVERFRFKPRHEGGKAVATPGVQYVFQYHLPDTAPVR